MKLVKFFLIFLYSLSSVLGQDIGTTEIKVVEGFKPKIPDAFRLNENSETEKKTKEIAIQEATLNAIKIPLQVMESSLDLMDLIEEIVEIGNPNSISDVGVAGLCARSAVLGAYLNVIINAKDYKEEKEKKKILLHAEKMKNKAIDKEKQIIEKTIKSISDS